MSERSERIMNSVPSGMSVPSASEVPWGTVPSGMSVPSVSGVQA
jgi:hypothetical protein